MSETPSSKQPDARKDASKSAVTPPSRRTPRVTTEVSNTPAAAAPMRTPPVDKDKDAEEELEEADIRKSSRNRKPRILEVIPSIVQANVAAEFTAEAAIGQNLRVFWPDERQWFQGYVEGYCARTNEHHVVYEDGDEETLVLATERIEWMLKPSRSKSAATTATPAKPPASTSPPAAKPAKKGSPPGAATKPTRSTSAPLSKEPTARPKRPTRTQAPSATVKVEPASSRPRTAPESTQPDPPRSHKAQRSSEKALDSSVKSSKPAEAPEPAAKAKRKPLQPGMQVWGKVKGHGYWPGYVATPKQVRSAIPRGDTEGMGPGLVLVYFFDGQYAWCSPETTLQFAPHLEKFRQSKRLPSFVQALEVAERKYKEKQQEKKRRAGTAGDGVAAPPVPAIPEAVPEAEVEDKKPEMELGKGCKEEAAKAVKEEAAKAETEKATKSDKEKTAKADKEKPSKADKEKAGKAETEAAPKADKEEAAKADKEKAATLVPKPTPMPARTLALTPSKSKVSSNNAAANIVARRSSRPSQPARNRLLEAETPSRPHASPSKPQRPAHVERRDAAASEARVKAGNGKTTAQPGKESSTRAIELEEAGLRGEKGEETVGAAGGSGSDGSSADGAKSQVKCGDDRPGVESGEGASGRNAAVEATVAGQRAGENEEATNPGEGAVKRKRDAANEQLQRARVGKKLKAAKAAAAAVTRPSVPRGAAEVPAGVTVTEVPSTSTHFTRKRKLQQHSEDVKPAPPKEVAGELKAAAVGKRQRVAPSPFDYKSPVSAAPAAKKAAQGGLKGGIGQQPSPCTGAALGKRNARSRPAAARAPSSSTVTPETKLRADGLPGRLQQLGSRVSPIMANASSRLQLHLAGVRQRDAT
eukprot:gene15294-18096_t